MHFAMSKGLLRCEPMFFMGAANPECDERRRPLSHFHVAAVASVVGVEGRSADYTANRI